MAATTKASPRRANVRAHGTEGVTSMQAQSTAPGRIDLTGIHATQVLVALREKPKGIADSTLARMLGSGQTGQMNLSSALRRMVDKGYRCPLVGDKRGRCKRVLREDPHVTLYDSDYGAAPGLSNDARRALAHINGRTRTGRFACRLWDVAEPEWGAALEELREAGYELVWTHGTVADDPTVTGGWFVR